jgi:hypothetical protein
MKDPFVMPALMKDPFINPTVTKGSFTAPKGRRRRLGLGSGA